MSDKNTLLEVEHLRKYYPIHSSFRKTEYVQAVEDVSFSIYEGETLGIVGESGCGKSTLGRSILRLTQPTGGRVLYRGEPVFDENRKKQPPMLPYRKKMQIIFQDPSASLDPRMTVGEIVGEALSVHFPNLKGQAYREQINRLLETVCSLLWKPGSRRYLWSTPGLTCWQGRASGTRRMRHRMIKRTAVSIPLRP